MYRVLYDDQSRSRRHSSRAARRHALSLLQLRRGMILEHWIWDLKMSAPSFYLPECPRPYSNYRDAYELVKLLLTHEALVGAYDDEVLVISWHICVGCSLARHTVVISTCNAHHDAAVHVVC